MAWCCFVDNLKRFNFIISTVNFQFWQKLVKITFCILSNIVARNWLSKSISGTKISLVLLLILDYLCPIIKSPCIVLLKPLL